MKRLHEWLKRVIRNWLGFGPSFIACDLSAVGRSMIVVATKHPKGDRVKVLAIDIQSIEHFERIVSDLSLYYGVPRHRVIIDKPTGIR